MAEKQLIMVVEGTAALGPFWKVILKDYLEKIIRSFAGSEVSGQNASSPNVEFALVMFTGHGSYSSCLVQRSGWTKVVDTFLQWLDNISFGGGGFNNVAVTEGLAESLMMFPSLSFTGGQALKKNDGKHCILVAASDPYPLPTPVYRPQLPSTEKIENADELPESRLSDAESVAKSYALSSVSLSVICPKQLLKMRAIYNAGKPNPHVTDIPVDGVTNTHHLVLISENFKEARVALSHSGTTVNNQSSMKVDTPSIPPIFVASATSVPSVSGINGSLSNRQPISVSNIPTAVKVEPNTGNMVPAPFPNISTVPRPNASQTVSNLQIPSVPVSQEMITSGDSMQDVKPVVSSMSSPVRPMAPSNSRLLNDISQARQVMNSASMSGASSIGLPSMGQTSVAMHMSNMISSGMTSSIPTGQNVFSAGQPGIPSMGGFGSMVGSAAVTQNTVAGSVNSVSSNIPGNANSGISQPLGGNLQGGVTMNQSVSGVSQGNVSSPQRGLSGIGINQTLNGVASSTVSPGNNQMMLNPNMPQAGLAQSGLQTLGTNNSSATSMPVAQQNTNAMNTAQSKYVKVWEGNLSGQRQGQPVFITRLEGYRSATAPENLAENWPSTMQIVRLISQDHMNNKQYAGKADFLVFRAINSHGFLGQLQEKKLCAVIQLVSQTLLLSVSDKPSRLIGMLFPGDMVVFKPQQMPGQQQQQLPQQNPQIQQMQQNQPFQQMQHNQQLQQLQQQQNNQLQHLQQNNQQQQQQTPQQLQPQQQQLHMVGSAINHGFAQGPVHSQLVPPQGQQQGTSQVMPNMQVSGAGGFIS